MKTSRIVNRREFRIDNPIHIVGDKRKTIFFPPNFRLATQFSQMLRRCRHCKWNHFNRNGRSSSKLRNQFFRRYENDQRFRFIRNDAFSQ
jgi:hypothetical protein